MIEIIANSKHKKSLLELEKIENILNREKIEYKVLKTSKTKNAQKLMAEVSSRQIIVIGGDGTIIIMEKILYTWRKDQEMTWHVRYD